MQITTVKDNGNNYKVNDGQFFIPKENGRKDDIKAVQQWIAEGGVVEPRFSLAEILELKIISKIESRKAYLNSTDWKVIKAIDESRPYSEEEKSKRAQARAEISLIGSCSTLEELNQFSLNFPQN